MNDQPRLAQTFAEVEDALLSRWPETRLEPSLDRIRAFTELLGDPQRTYPVIHLTGTNGKTSTLADDRHAAARPRAAHRPVHQPARRVDDRADQPRRRAADRRAVRDARSTTSRRTSHLVDARPATHPLSFFETVVAMAYAAFADAPVDVAVVEVGHGRHVGRHQRGRRRGRGGAARSRSTTRSYLGDDAGRRSPVEKAGIIKPGSIAVARRAAARRGRRGPRAGAEVGATLVREGVDFGVVTRVPGRRRPDGRRCRGCAARYDEVFLPLYGAHQAQNAAVALAAVEAFLGSDDRWTPSSCAAAFAEVTSPGRLEIIRRSPTIVLDAAHNPHGAEATAAALEDSFTVRPADRRHRRDGRQGPRGRCWRRSSRTWPTSCAPRTPPPARCRPSELAEVAARDLRRGPGHRRAASWPTPSTRRPAWPRPGVFGRVDRLRRRARHRLGRHRRRGAPPAAAAAQVTDVRRRRARALARGAACAPRSSPRGASPSA